MEIHHKKSRTVALTIHYRFVREDYMYRKFKWLAVLLQIARSAVGIVVLVLPEAFSWLHRG